MEFEQLSKMFDGENENKISDEASNVLKEIPESKMRLYCYSCILKTDFFNTLKELDNYVNSGHIHRGEKVFIDYLGHMADKNDVIRVIYSDNSIKYFSVVDEIGIVIYNEEKSNALGKYVWDYEVGDLKDIYKAFNDRGIKFEKDVYKIQDGIYSSVSDDLLEHKIRK